MLSDFTPDSPPEFAPEPEPGRALVPPVRHPPTAVATATPPPPRPPRSVRVRPQGPAVLRLLRRGVDALLDAADQAGDRVAEALGLRPPAA